MAGVCHACEAPAAFTVKRIHDGGGKRITCGAHLEDTVREVAASVPDWATNPTSAVHVMGTGN